MTDVVLGAAQELMASPWIYVVVLAVAAIDGFFPVVPSESLVITAGVFAAHGEPNLLGIIAVAAAGAFVGDHTSYLIGRASHSRLDRLPPGRRHDLVAWARGALGDRGGLVLVAARYIPGGRTAVTLTMGAVRYPVRSFSSFAALAALTWATYSAFVGVIGGHSFEEDPLKGVVLGISLAIALTVVVEYLRHRRRRRLPTEQAPEPERSAPSLPCEGVSTP